MVPDKFNMVDMGGIDLIMMQGEAVPCLHEKLMAAISSCQYQCLYNWLFDGVLIPPTYVQLTDQDGEIYLNEGVSVTSDNVIHIYSIEPAPVEPEIIPLFVEENGVYNVPTGKDGFNPVTVDVPSYTPVITPITITENGIYVAPSGVDGYSPVTVNVSGGLTPITITPIINNASYIGANGNLVVGNTSYPDYRTIAVDLSQYHGYLISIVNSGNRNFYGLYDSITNEQPIKLFNSRQTSIGTLEFYVDDWVQFGQWLVYDYTSTAQSPPSVIGYVI